MRSCQRNYCLSQQLTHNCTFPKKLVYFYLTDYEVKGNRQAFPFSVELVVHLEQMCGSSCQAFLFSLGTLADHHPSIFSSTQLYVKNLNHYFSCCTFLSTTLHYFGDDLVCKRSCMSEDVFIALSYLIDYLPEYRILSLKTFFP